MTHQELRELDPPYANLSQDIGKQENLASANPQRAAEMLARLRAWRKETNAALPHGQ
jgi:hypothetical protein